MIDILQFLYLPFLAGLILTGIHAYLGVHVVERGVIFVDLSLAQIAALGTTMAVLRGLDPHSPTTYWWSLGFTIIGAAVFALTRVHRETRIPQEAIIGIVYAVSAAAAILAMSKATGETEHLKDMLVGNILSVSGKTVATTALLYAGVGLFHFIFRKQFLAISTGNEIPNLKLWDFLFYMSFGFVVTSDRTVGRGDALLAIDRQAAGDRLDDGSARERYRHPAVVQARSADRRDDRLHIRHRSRADGGGVGRDEEAAARRVSVALMRPWPRTHAAASSSRGHFPLPGDCRRASDR
jgi:hypothetical protein